MIQVPYLERLMSRVADHENLKALEDRRPDLTSRQIIPTGGTTVCRRQARTHNCYIENVEYHARRWEVTSNIRSW
jgi:hypothetical protein